jgi:hypothetical protein
MPHEGATSPEAFMSAIKMISVCGIKALYVPRSHPDGFSVNARCIDSDTIEDIAIRPLNGREWEKQYPAGRGGFES